MRWAIETGIIERLYKVDRGVTVQIAEAGMEALGQFHARGKITADARALITDQREALEMVMYIVGGTRSLSSSYIKELHHRLALSQKTCEAEDQFGKHFQARLRKGAWKIMVVSPALLPVPCFSRRITSFSSFAMKSAEGCSVSRRIRAGTHVFIINCANRLGKSLSLLEVCLQLFLAKLVWVVADVPPENRLHVTRQMADIRRRNDAAPRVHSRDLCYENDVAIECPVVGGRLVTLTSVCLEHGRLPHRCGREWQVLDQFDQRIKPSEFLLAASSQQLAAYFVIGDFRRNDARTGRNKCLKPLGASHARG